MAILVLSLIWFISPNLFTAKNKIKEKHAFVPRILVQALSWEFSSLGYCGLGICLDFFQISLPRLGLR